MLAVAYHLGANTALAQRSGPVQVEIVGASSTAFMLAEPIEVKVSNEPLSVTVDN